MTLYASNAHTTSIRGTPEAEISVPQNQTCQGRVLPHQKAAFFDLYRHNEKAAEAATFTHMLLYA